MSSVDSALEKDFFEDADVAIVQSYLEDILIALAKATVRYFYANGLACQHYLIDGFAVR